MPFSDPSPSILKTLFCHESGLLCYRCAFIISLCSYKKKKIKNYTDLHHPRSLSRSLRSSGSQYSVFNTTKACFEDTQRRLSKPPRTFQQLIAPRSLLPQGGAALAWPTLPPDGISLSPLRRPSRNTPASRRRKLARNKTRRRKQNPSWNFHDGRWTANRS